MTSNTSSSIYAEFYRIQTPAAKAVLTVYIIEYFAGLFATSVLIYAILRERTKLLKRKIDQAQFVVIVCIWLWAFPGSMVSIRALVMNGWDYVGCNAIGSTIGISCVSDIVGQGLMALDRYCTIIIRKPLKTKEFNRILISFIVLAIICSTMSWFPQFQFVPRDGVTWCVFDFANKSIIRQLPGIIIILTCVCSLGAIVFAYISIYMVVYSASNRIENVKTTTGTGVGTNDEQKILIRCVTLMICFSMCYAVDVSCMVYEVLSRNETPPLLGMVGTVFATSECFLTPIVCVWFNSDYQHAIYKHIFGQDNWVDIVDENRVDNESTKASRG